MRLTFDREYFVNYSEVSISGNRNGRYIGSQSSIEREDLIALSELIAYQLADSVTYDTMRSPDIGESELRNEISTEDLRALDFSKTFLFESTHKVKSLTHDTQAKIIKFLLASRMANIETILRSETEKQKTEHEINNLLHLTTNHQNLQNFFSNVSIAIGSPLLYTRLGADILSVADLDWDKLWSSTKNNALLGRMLEVYIRGALTQLETPLTAFSSIKLVYNGEVDIYKPSFLPPILCEVTAQRRPKTMEKINLLNYFPDEPIIRICCTESHSDDIYGFHRIPYAQLCCMIDTGDIFKLAKSTSADIGRSLSETGQFTISKKL